MASVTAKFKVKIKSNVKWWFKWLPLVILERIMKVDFEMVTDKENK